MSDSPEEIKLQSAEINETDNSINLTEAKTSDAVLSQRILLVNQACEILSANNSSCLTQPIEILTVEGNYIVADLQKAPKRTLVKLAPSVISDLEPPEKQRRSNLTFEDGIKQILDSIQETILQRLDKIEEKIKNVTVRCYCLEEKIENIVCSLKVGGFNNRLTYSTGKGKSGTIIVGLPPSEKSGSLVCSSSLGTFSSSNTRSSMQLIPLNSEADYPNGSWLGDPENPEQRVRCHVSPQDLNSVNESCTTAEKMALTLLDYLFDRETQACSNISGTGKHEKKQLDPLKIYGIRCHVSYKFDVTEKDWHRIKQNLDSKCRTAFRRKQKGMPLTVKAFRDRTTCNLQQLIEENDGSHPSSPVTVLSSDSHQELHVSISETGEISSDHDIGLSRVIPLTLHGPDGTTVSFPLPQFTEEPQIIHTDRGDIQVVHATPEQLAEIQQARNVQILAVPDILRQLLDAAPSSESCSTNTS